MLIWFKHPRFFVLSRNEVFLDLSGSSTRQPLPQFFSLVKIKPHPSKNNYFNPQQNKLIFS